MKPPLVVISDHGKTTTDFGEVSIGQNIIKSITIQNISKKTLEVCNILVLINLAKINTSFQIDEKKII